MSREFIIYADESIQKGQFYSNFYGGALIRSKDLEITIEILENHKKALNLGKEIKWQRVTSQYLIKYMSMMDEFFSFIAKDIIKIRIMFTKNSNVPTSLTPYHYDNQYHLLYYEFLKDCFGFQYCNPNKIPTKLRIYLDKMPDTTEKNLIFKKRLVDLNKLPKFNENMLTVQEDQIAEVDSKQHIILQCMDVVMGAMQFRLNDLHKVIPEGSKRRGKRTVAKEKLYRHINQKIREFYPNFNIGISTGTQGQLENRWFHPYRHRVFSSRESSYDPSKTKSNN